MGVEEEATPTLDAADMAIVTQLGAARQVREGEYLYREGDVTYDFFVLVNAEVDIVVTVDGAERFIIHHGPGRFLGELNMLSGLRVLVSARVVMAGEIVVVPRERLRQLMATKPRLGDTILAAFVARRGLLMTGAAPSIRVMGSQFSRESLHIREFLIRTRIPHEYLDADSDPQVEALLGQFGIAASELPVVVATGCAEPLPATWPAISASPSRACQSAASTWWWSEAAHRAWRQPSTEHPRGCAPSRWR